MYEQTAHRLQTAAGEKIALQSVSAEVVINNLLSEASLTQVYQNREEKPIEAVYTFPLPSRAVLLGVKLSIGQRELTGSVIS
jgi:Ca-activated chloride channel family protein